MQDITNELSGAIDEIISNYERPIELIDGLSWSQKDTVKRIYFYSLSSYLSGDKDGLGRRKPFKNIVNQVVDVDTRSTDIDIKNIQLVSEDGDYSRTMLLEKELQNWMRKHDFGMTIDSLNETKCRYGGVLAKKVIKDGELFIEPASWINTITDQQNIEAGAIIERYWLSPTEIRKMSGIWDNIEEAVLSADKYNGNQQDTSNTNKIEILEIEGEFPDTYLDEDADEDAYSFMMIIIAVANGKKILLYANEKKESSYKYHSRKNVDQRALGMGVVEEGFEAQISTNEAAISERIAFELGGKVVVKTNAANIGTNAVTEIEDGTILELEDNEFFETQSLLPSNIPEYQRLMTDWFEQYTRTASSFSSLTGEEPVSGTPFRSLALQSAQAKSIHDYRRDQFGYFIRDIIKDWVLPFLAKKITSEHILESAFSSQELDKIDTAFATIEVNNIVKEAILNGEIPEQTEILVEQVKQGLRDGHKSRRKISVPKGYFKDLYKKLSIIITDEQIDRSARMQTLYEIWQSMTPEDPNKQQIFDEMVELSDATSPASLTKAVSTGSPQAQGQMQKTAVASEIGSVLPQAQQ